MKYVPVLEIIKAIDTLYYEFEGRLAEDEEDKQKTFSSDSITNTRLVKTLDSLYPINKLEFTSRLESGFYGDFFGNITIEDLSKDEYKDKNDERLVNPNFLTFSYFKCEACGGYQESYFLLNNGKLKKLNLEPLTEKDKELLNEKVNKLLGLNDEAGIGNMNKILKIKEGINEIYLNVRSEGGGFNTEDGIGEKYHEHGELRYQIKDFESIVPNTVEFYSKKTDKWYRL